MQDFKQNEIQEARKDFLANSQSTHKPTSDNSAVAAVLSIYADFGNELDFDKDPINTVANEMISNGIFTEEDKPLFIKDLQAICDRKQSGIRSGAVALPEQNRKLSLKDIICLIIRAIREKSGEKYFTVSTYKERLQKFYSCVIAMKEEENNPEDMCDYGRRNEFLVSIFHQDYQSPNSPYTIYIITSLLGDLTAWTVDYFTKRLALLEQTDPAAAFNYIKLWIDFKKSRFEFESTEEKEIINFINISACDKNPSIEICLNPPTKEQQQAVIELEKYLLIKKDNRHYLGFNKAGKYTELDFQELQKQYDTEIMDELLSCINNKSIDTACEICLMNHPNDKIDNNALYLYVTERENKFTLHYKTLKDTKVIVGDLETNAIKADKLLKIIELVKNKNIDDLAQEDKELLFDIASKRGHVGNTLLLVDKLVADQDGLLPLQNFLNYRLALLGILPETWNTSKTLFDNTVKDDLTYIVSNLDELPCPSLGDDTIMFYLKEKLASIHNKLLNENELQEFNQTKTLTEFKKITPWLAKQICSIQDTAEKYKNKLPLGKDWGEVVKLAKILFEHSTELLKQEKINDEDYQKLVIEHDEFQEILKKVTESEQDVNEIIPNSFAYFCEKTSKTDKNRILNRVKELKSKFYLTDNDLQIVAKRNLNSETKECWLEPYDINRVLWQALLTDPADWSKFFIEALQSILEFIKKPTIHFNEQEFIKSYPVALINQLDFLKELYHCHHEKKSIANISNKLFVPVDKEFIISFLNNQEIEKTFEDVMNMMKLIEPQQRLDVYSAVKEVVIKKLDKSSERWLQFLDLIDEREKLDFIKKTLEHIDYDIAVAIAEKSHVSNETKLFLPTLFLVTNKIEFRDFLKIRTKIQNSLGYENTHYIDEKLIIHYLKNKKIKITFKYLIKMMELIEPRQRLDVFRAVKEAAIKKLDKSSDRWLQFFNLFKNHLIEMETCIGEGAKLEFIKETIMHIDNKIAIVIIQESHTSEELKLYFLKFFIENKKIELEDFLKLRACFTEKNLPSALQSFIDYNKTKLNAVYKLIDNSKLSIKSLGILLEIRNKSEYQNNKNDEDIDRKIDNYIFERIWNTFLLSDQETTDICDAIKALNNAPNLAELFLEKLLEQQTALKNLLLKNETELFLFYSNEKQCDLKNSLVAIVQAYQNNNFDPMLKLLTQFVNKNSILIAINKAFNGSSTQKIALIKNLSHLIKYNDDFSSVINDSFDEYNDKINAFKELKHLINDKNLDPCLIFQALRSSNKKLFEDYLGCKILKELNTVKIKSEEFCHFFSKYALDNLTILQTLKVNLAELEPKQMYVLFNIIKRFSKDKRSKAIDKVKDLIENSKALATIITAYFHTKPEKQWGIIDALPKILALFMENCMNVIKTSDDAIEIIKAFPYNFKFFMTKMLCDKLDSSVILDKENPLKLSFPCQINILFLKIQKTDDISQIKTIVADLLNAATKQELSTSSFFKSYNLESQPCNYEINLLMKACKIRILELVDENLKLDEDSIKILQQKRVHYLLGGKETHSESTTSFKIFNLLQEKSPEAKIKLDIEKNTLEVAFEKFASQHELLPNKENDKDSKSCQIF